MAHDPTYNLLHTQVRYDLDGLNSEASGWIAAEDADNFDVDWGTVFRIRARVSETAGYGSNKTLKWQVKRNAGSFVDVGTGNGDSTSPAIAVVSDQFDDEDTISTEYLTSGGGSFINGEGDENSSISTTIDSQETEFETAFMTMFPFDGPTFNADADTLEFRLVENDGTVFGGTDNTVTITVNDPGNNYLGGTFSESPGRVIWADGNKNIYALIETSETDPRLMMMKSTDGGTTWVEMDGSNRPTQIDMESVDGILENDRIYIAHSDQGDDIYQHVFVVSTDGTSPDTWETTDELVTGTITLNQNPQTVSIARRGDGDKIVFYIRNNGSLDQAYYKIDTGGGWGSEQTLDTETSHHCKGIASVRGESDKIHIFYNMEEASVDGSVYHRSLDSGDTLSDREEVDASTGWNIANRWNFTTPIYWDDGGDEMIMIVYKDADHYLYSVVVENDGSPDTRKAASDNTSLSSPGSTDSQQTTADLSVDGSDAYLHYADRTTADLFRDENSNNGSWGTDTEEQDGLNINWIRTTIFTHSAGNGSAKVVGQLYDNGSDGGTGYIYYREYEIAAGGNFQSAAGVLTPVGILSKETSKAPTGSVTSAGILVKSSTKTFTGSVTASGILAASKIALLAIGGVITASGTLIKQTGKLFTGSLTPVGSLVKRTAKIFVGSLTPAGTLVKRTAKAFTGSITTIGSLATQKISGYFQVVGGVLTMSGIVVKQTNKKFIGSVTTAGSLIKRAGKVLSGSLTPSGILAASKATLLSISGSLTPSGILIRQTGKIVLGSLTATGTLIKQTTKTFVGSLTAAGSLIKRTAKTFIGSVTAVGSLATQKISGGYFQVVGGAMAMTGTLTRKTSKIFTGSITAVGILAKRTVKSFTGSITAVGSLITQKSMFQVISGVLTMAGVLVRQTSKRTAGIMTMTGSIAKQISKSFTGAITAVGTLARQILGLPVPAIRIYAIRSENRVCAISVEERIYSIIKEKRVYTINGSYISLSVPSWIVGTSQVGGVDQIT